jgi:molecular chaperone DnaK (HSP70)
VIDLGGGTYDVTLLQMDKGSLTVMASKGDTHLGGEDFDQEIVKLCVRQFK